MPAAAAMTPASLTAKVARTMAAVIGTTLEGHRLMDFHLAHGSGYDNGKSIIAA